MNRDGINSFWVDLIYGYWKWVEEAVQGGGGGGALYRGWV